MQQKLLVEWETYYSFTYFSSCIASVNGHIPGSSAQDTSKDPPLQLSSLQAFLFLLSQVLYPTWSYILTKHTTPGTKLQPYFQDTQ